MRMPIHARAHPVLGLQSIPHLHACMPQLVDFDFSVDNLGGDTHWDLVADELIATHRCRPRTRAAGPG